MDATRIPIGTLQNQPNFPTFGAQRRDVLDPNVTYYGYGAPGTVDADEYWAICRVTFTEVDGVYKTEWVNGRATFVNKWTLRATYTYA